MGRRMRSPKPWAMVAAALLVAGFVAAAKSIGSGKGGNLGFALLAFVFWLLALIAVAICVLVMVVRRRSLAMFERRKNKAREST